MVIGSTGDWIPARALLGPNDELERLRTVSRALSHQNPSFPRKNVTPADSKPGGNPDRPFRIPTSDSLAEMTFFHAHTWPRLSHFTKLTCLMKSSFGNWARR